MRNFDIIREAQKLDDKRSDILLKYGFLQPILIETKQSNNNDVKSIDSYKEKLTGYVDGFHVCKGIYLIMKVKSNHGDGNGRIGRLWQTVILGSWNPLFYYLPVESVIRDNQTEYYKVLGESDKAGDSSLFIDFITTAIASALKEITTDQVNDYVNDQVKSLIKVLGYATLSPADIMEKLSLSHRTNFRIHYLNPALEAGYIEMTVPDKPSSRNQKYRLTVAGV
ncbi:MAG: hypothetical protein A2015_13325 [Spirochaetes bacterium GWF1_31_7]|nr:MAG: hypothetical protein A2Y29_07245 [Spirochaetes bacterium GWE2_31_10]OHD49228.1 MAG: hypothetical protein A2015_13325 [Spirochaetes bacterium GWF1_31_7]HBD95480.1 hypothetical protein [Spirochaetia bacterium]